MVGIPVKGWEFFSVVVRGVSVCLEPTHVVGTNRALRDESENEPGETEDSWDPSDEQDKGDTKPFPHLVSALSLT